VNDSAWRSTLQSMGSVGDHWDNALQESGIGTIKAELVARHDFTKLLRSLIVVFEGDRTLHIGEID
jgi:hypothetical protein